MGVINVQEIWYGQRKEEYGYEVEGNVNFWTETTKGSPPKIKHIVGDPGFESAQQIPWGARITFTTAPEDNQSQLFLNDVPQQEVVLNRPKINMREHLYTIPLFVVSNTPVV